MKALPKEKIKADAAAVKLSLGERKIFDLVSADADREITKKNPYVVLKYFQDSWECFSAWEKDELKQLSAFLRRLGSHTWQQVYETAGKSGKHGLAYTKYELSHIKGSAKEQLEKVKKLISEDIDFFELRVDQNKLRVHGFQSQAAFFLVLLDREHSVFPMG
ncbi:hypothetical protein EJD96_18185 [Herbaspirillum seropedicae]|uniref:hypothetical protein n=1 Tax=Herbaspirillum seropedicae TaxID=964 RepID=UPI00111EC463|nr:hypothetical protein [Herbaspirillum seropedicae]QDD65959.1 hypothetical protein EJD96_18185 [Herbaspirillum seropedicae]